MEVGEQEGKPGGKDVMCDRQERLTEVKYHVVEGGRIV